MKVLVVGYNAWDVILPCTRLPARDSKQECSWMFTGGGGPAATAAVALSRLGADVAYVGVLADDPPGEMQRTELLAAGVGLELAVSQPGGATPLAVSLVDEPRAERRICWSRGELRRLRVEEVDPSWLDGRDLLFCDGHEPEAATHLARAAHERGIPCVLDGGTPRSELAPLVAVCSDVIGSESFARGLTGRDDPLQALRALRTLGPDRVATTHGAAGCVTLVGDRPVHIPAYAVSVQDTTGAGDAFHAGYAWARLSGRDLQAALACGAAVSALGCRARGGRSGLPTAAEVADFMAWATPLATRPDGYGF